MVSQKLVRELRNAMPVDQIAGELERMRTSSADGKSFTTGWFDLDQMVWCLAAASHFDEDITDTDRITLCRNAAFSVAANGEITKKKLQSAVARGIGEFKKRPKKPFILLTSVGLRLWQKRIRKQHKGAYIYLVDIPPEGFDRSHVPDQLLKFEDRPFYRRFATVRIRIHARSEFESKV